MRTLIAATLAVAAPASAKTIARATPETRSASIDVRSGATIASTGLLASDAGDTTVATLTLTFTAKELMAASTTLALPDGARVVGMTLGHGDQRFVARPLALEEAEHRFAVAVDPPHEIVVPRPVAKRDPAIVQIERDGVVRLTVFPISPGDPATVTLQLALPHEDGVELRVGGRFERRADKVLASVEELAAAARPDVLSADRVLYAAPIAPEPSVQEIASTVEAVLPTLGRCAAVDDRETVQHVSLQIAVDAFGHASIANTDGANGNLKDCLQQMVEAIELGDDAATTLTYSFDVRPPPAPVAQR